MHELTVFIVFLGSAHVKAGRKMLAKLTPGKSGFRSTEEAAYCNHGYQPLIVTVR